MNKNVVIFTSIAVVVTVAAIIVVYLGSYDMSPSPNSEANATETNGFNKELKLLSISALDSSRSLIGPLNENQSFRIHEPIYIQANFSNLNNNSSDHIIASEIRGPDGTSALSHVQATVGGSGQLSVEVYWKPDQVGDYKLLLFQILPEKLNRGPITQPVAVVPLKVIE